MAYTRLHHELAAVADVLAETDSALAAKRAAAAELDTLARRCWGEGVTAVVFGSAECGLALRGAGLDVVVAGVTAVPSPDNANGSGYSSDSKALVVQQLRSFERYVQPTRHFKDVLLDSLQSSPGVAGRRCMS